MLYEIHILFSEDHRGVCSSLEYVFASREHVEKYLNSMGVVYASDNSEGSYYVDGSDNYYLVVTEPIMVSDEKGLPKQLEMRRDKLFEEVIKNRTTRL